MDLGMAIVELRLLSEKACQPRASRFFLSVPAVCIDSPTPQAPSSTATISSPTAGLDNGRIDLRDQGRVFMISSDDPAHMAGG